MMYSRTTKEMETASSRHQKEAPKKRGRPPGTKTKTVESTNQKVERSTPSKFAPRRLKTSSPAVNPPMGPPGDTIASRLVANRRLRSAKDSPTPPKTLPTSSRSQPKPRTSSVPTPPKAWPNSILSRPRPRAPTFPSASPSPEPSTSKFEAEEVEEEPEVLEEEVFADEPEPPDNPSVIVLKDNPRLEQESDSEDELIDEPPLQDPSEKEEEIAGVDEAEKTPHDSSEELEKSFSILDKINKSKFENAENSETSTDVSNEEVKKQAEELYQQYLLDVSRLTDKSHIGSNHDEEVDAVIDLRSEDPTKPGGSTRKSIIAPIQQKRVSFAPTPNRGDEPMARSSPMVNHPNRVSSPEKAKRILSFFTPRTPQRNHDPDTDDPQRNNLIEIPQPNIQIPKTLSIKSSDL
ncbi:proteoglycan 4-like [Diachasma alloeum]|uniref:proteoglycan 4-like n=1 Tax=Diachasma alloeum TaxID=454923 RepID=UPI00073811DE|nr:proteoglycan 4-like [Diachasma alloeum]